MSAPSTKSLIIACGALAHEIVALKKMNQWDNMHIQCLPADLHNYPQKIPAKMRAAIVKARDHYEHIYVAYGDCGTGGLLDNLLDEFGIERLPGAHCYQFYAGAEKYDELMEEELGSFFVTDFLVKHFDRLIIKGMGLDKHPELMSMYFGNYKKLVFLDQTKSSDLERDARKAADKLGLEFQYRYTGMQGLEAPLKFFHQRSEIASPKI